MADSSSHMVTDIAAVVQRQQALLEAQQLQLQALTEELRALVQPLDVQPDTPDQPDTHTNFIATGPGIGFLTQAQTNEGMSRGVIGIGSDGFVDRIAETVGVVGYTATLDGTIQNGVGVHGITAGGTAVRGSDTGAGVGLEGVTATGTGVRGSATDEGAFTVGVEGVTAKGTGVRGSVTNEGVGVEGVSNGAIGVFGFGRVTGVEGDGDTVGVLGGGPSGRVFEAGTSVYTGVLGNGPIDTGGITFTYGGWFDAINGTAPVHLEPSQNPQPPAAGQAGDVFVDNIGNLWFCTATGDNDPNPPTWRQVQLG